MSWNTVVGLGEGREMGDDAREGGVCKYEVRFTMLWNTVVGLPGESREAERGNGRWRDAGKERRCVQESGKANDIPSHPTYLDVHERIDDDGDEEVEEDEHHQDDV